MITWQEIFIRLLLASVLGAVIGLERERKDLAAGMRTHMMVCLGSSLIMIVSAFGFSDILGTPNVSLDPSRIAAQVVSGIGFIGAGTIMFLKQKIIRGLTTAAGLWTVAAIGLAVGGGMYFAAMICTVLAIFILWIIQPLEKRIFAKFKSKYVRIVVTDRNKSFQIIDRIFSSKIFEVESFSFDEDENDSYTIAFRFKTFDKSGLALFVKELHAESEIKEINWD